MSETTQPSSPSLTTLEHDVYFGRGTIGVVSMIVSPMALALLFTSTSLLQDVSATGTPLGSPGGQLGMLISAVLITLIAHSARWSTIGISILTAWSGVFAAMVALHTFDSPAAVTSMESLLFWSQLPLLTFMILLAATLATRVVRKRKERSKVFHSPTVVEMLVYALGALLIGLAVVILLYDIAPRTAEALILEIPALAQVPTMHGWMTIAMIGGCLFILTWLATRAFLVVQLVGWLVMLIPGLFIIPLIATIWGGVATPQNTQLLALGYTLPVIGVLGMIIVTSTHSFSLMLRRS